jgi:hypothetical protein
MVILVLASRVVELTRGIKELIILTCRDVTTREVKHQSAKRISALMPSAGEKSILIGIALKQPLTMRLGMESWLRNRAPNVDRQNTSMHIMTTTQNRLKSGGFVRSIIIAYMESRSNELQRLRPPEP